MSDDTPGTFDQDTDFDWLHAFAADVDTNDISFRAELPFDVEDSDTQPVTTMSDDTETFWFVPDPADIEDIPDADLDSYAAFDWERDVPTLEADMALSRHLDLAFRLLDADFRPQVDAEAQAQNGRAIFAMRAAGIEVPDDEVFDLHRDAFHTTRLEPGALGLHNVWFIPSIFHGEHEPDRASGWQSALVTLEESTPEQPMDAMIVPFGAVGDFDMAMGNAQQLGTALMDRGLDSAFDVMREIDMQQPGVQLDLPPAESPRDPDMDIR